MNFMQIPRKIVNWPISYN